MKTRILSLFLSLVLLSACSSKWQLSKDHFPEEFLAEQERILEEQLDILKDDPFNVTANFEAGYRYGQLGKLKKAEQYYLNVLELAPSHKVALNNIANTYVKAEEYELAAVYIKRLFELQPGSVETLKDTVNTLLLADDPENAKIALETFVKNSAGESGLPDPNYGLLVSELFQDIADYEEAHATE